jgi:hypothetical protein
VGPTAATPATTGWPTPQTHDDKLRGNTEADCHYSPHDLSNAATLSSWSPPTQWDSEGGGQAAQATNPARSNDLGDFALLASWSTPRNEDAESAGMRLARGTADTLTAQTSLAAWATPAERDYRTANLKSFEERGGGKKGEQLPNQVKHLAGWPTPMAGSPATEDYNEAGNTDSSRKTVALAAWPSPCTPNGGRSMSTDQMDATGKTLDGRKHTASLEHAVKFAGPVRLTASGLALTGSDAGMESSGQCQGQLNPAHSAWLMGIPPIWDIFCFRAAKAMRSRRSSKKEKKELAGSGSTATQSACPPRGRSLKHSLKPSANS